MRVDGIAGRGNRHYGTDPLAVLRGRLMDEGETYVVPSNAADDLADDLEELLAVAEDDANAAIDDPLTRWGYDIADERYWKQ